MTKSRFLQALEAGESRTLVLYGTSLTDAPWAQMLSTWLSRRFPGRARLINSAVSGKASRTALDLLETHVLAHAPDCVLLEFAVNDATRVYASNDRDFNISLDESQANIDRMITLILAARPACEIFLQTMNSAWDAPNGRRSASLRPNLDAYYEGYRVVARKRGLRLIDHHPHWVRLQATNGERFGSFVPDGVHPVQAGHEAITFPAVLSALGGQEQDIAVPEERIK
jgi:acyl-CoA thioesterase I